MKSNERRGRWKLLGFAAPLAICLPCLLPLILGAVLTSVGVGAVGSFLSDNAILLALSASVAGLVALAAGLIIWRLACRVGGASRRGSGPRPSPG